MNIDASAFLKTSGIPCIEVVRSPQVDRKRNAVFAYVTEASIQMLREHMRDKVYHESSNKVTAFYGGAVAGSSVEGGEYRFISPGEHAEFYFDLNGTMLPLTGSGMISLREKMIEHVSSGGTLDQSAEKVLVDIQNIFEMIQSAPDPERFPDSLVALSYRARIIEVFGHVQCDLPDAVLCRAYRGNLIKAGISAVDPNHIDGLSYSVRLNDILLAFGIDVSSSSVSESLDPDRYSNITEDGIREGVIRNDGIRDIFASITKTNIAELSVAALSSKDINELISKAGDSKLSGGWIESVTDTFKNHLAENDEDRDAQVHVFSIAGRDILIVQDKVCLQKEIAFAYSWKTVDRYPVVEIDGVKHLATSEEEAESDERIKELHASLKKIISEKKNLKNSKDRQVLDQ